MDEALLDNIHGDGLQVRSLISVTEAELVEAELIPTLKREAQISDKRPGLGMFYETVEGAAWTDSTSPIGEPLAITRRHVREYSRAHE